MHGIITPQGEYIQNLPGETHTEMFHRLCKEGHTECLKRGYITVGYYCNQMIVDFFLMTSQQLDKLQELFIKNKYMSVFFVFKYNKGVQYYADKFYGLTPDEIVSNCR